MVSKLRGIAAIADRFDAVLSDVWGVVHNGRAAHAAALEALVQLRQRDKPVILVSNTPRPAPPIHRQLEGFGVLIGTHYDALVTAGDMARLLMSGRYAGARAWHLGPTRDLPVFDQVPVTQVERPEDAEVVVCTGFFHEDTETAEDYRPLLETLLSRRLPLICANPDIIVHRGDDVLPCAGAIAVLYEEMGGPVHYCGKPYPEIYAGALKVASACLGRAVQRDRVLTIGDGLETDIRGARTNGLPALFIASGIHRGEDVSAAAFRPDWVLDELCW